MKLNIRELLLLVAGIAIGLAIALTLLNSVRGIESGTNNAQNAAITDLKLRVEELKAHVFK